MIFTISGKSIHLQKKKLLWAYQVLDSGGKAENTMVTWKHPFSLEWVSISRGKGQVGKQATALVR